MQRVDLYNQLNTVADTYSVGQLKSHISSDCLILRKGLDIPSLQNSIGFWDVWNIDVYSPTSPLQVELLVKKILVILTNNSEIEVTNSFGGNYFDEKLGAFSTIIEFRVPKTIKFK